MPDSNLTKKALASAMKELMTERPFQKISVGDICERCGMNRKSFYYPFIDKYDLVNWIFYTEFVSTLSARDAYTGWGILRDACTYLYENRRFYANALTITGQNAFSDYFASLLRPLITYQMSDLLAGDENIEFYQTFFSDAFIMSVRRWLTENPDMNADTYVTLLKNAMLGLAESSLRQSHLGRDKE